MKLFMLRWQDGTTSIVGAPTKDEAFMFADCAWDDPFGAEVTELKRIAMDITPKLRIESETEHTRVDFDVEFGDFGGDEEFDPLMQIAYPALRDGMDEAFDEPNQNELVKDAFDKEIKRNVVSLFDSKRRSLAPCPMMAIYDRTTGGEE